MPEERVGSLLIILHLSIGFRRRETVQAIADDAINPLDAHRREGIGELVCNGRHPLAPCLGLPRGIADRLRAAVTRVKSGKDA